MNEEQPDWMKETPLPPVYFPAKCKGCVLAGQCDYETCLKGKTVVLTYAEVGKILKALYHSPNAVVDTVWFDPWCTLVDFLVLRLKEMRDARKTQKDQIDKGLEICEGCEHCVQDEEWDKDNPPAYCVEEHVLEFWKALHEREEMYRVHEFIEHEYDAGIFDGVPLNTDEGDSGPGGLMPGQCHWRSPPGFMHWFEEPGHIMRRALFILKEERAT
jgi:hypothetical protein